MCAKHIAYSFTVYHHIAHSVWAQYVAYSHVHFRYSIYIVWAQNVASNYTAYTIVYIAMSTLQPLFNVLLCFLQHASCGHRKLITAIRFFTIQHKSDGARVCVKPSNLSPYCTNGWTQILVPQISFSPWCKRTSSGSFTMSSSKKTNIWLGPRLLRRELRSLY